MNAQRTSKYLGKFIVTYRATIVASVNVLLWSLSYLISLNLRFDFDTAEFWNVERLAFPLSVLLFCRQLTYMYWGLNQGYWRYSSTHDLFNLIKAHLVSSLLFTAIVMFLRVSEFPRAVIFIDFFLSICLLGGARFFVRLVRESVIASLENTSGSAGRSIFVIGAGESGHLLIKQFLSHSKLNYRPVAVFDDADRLSGTNVHGVPVVGPLASLSDAFVDFPDVSAVIVAIPSLGPSKFSAVREVCGQAGVLLKKIQSFEDIACLDSGPGNDRISIEALLERETEVPHEDHIRKQLQGKRVLVTGAGGSIGSELVRQILKFDPSVLVLFDHSEFNLYQILNEIRAGELSVPVLPVLGSITDKRRLAQVFEEALPQYVFHAAAYKHVPLMESNAYEAVKNNVIGTRNVLEASKQFGSERFVMISTDKAVDPSSLMGCSKRLGEILAQHYSFETPSLETAVVRFGNVINSAGSVIPLFKQQIIAGGPLTVTHPEMERYFMSIREAVRLVLTAGVLGRGGAVFVLDMGKPIKILDVARRMLTLYGRRDIPIAFTGVRPGEKLSEELTGTLEEFESTGFEKVKRVRCEASSYHSILSGMLRLEREFATLSEGRSQELFVSLPSRVFS